MARDFALDEQETVFTVEATDRSVVHVYSNDIVYQRRLERVGCMPYRTAEDGGKFYKLSAKQLSIRKPPRVMTDEEREKASERLRLARQTIA